MAFIWPMGLYCCASGSIGGPITFASSGLARSTINETAHEKRGERCVREGTGRDMGVCEAHEEGEGAWGRSHHSRCPLHLKNTVLWSLRPEGHEIRKRGRPGRVALRISRGWRQVARAPVGASAGGAARKLDPSKEEKNPNIFLDEWPGASKLGHSETTEKFEKLRTYKCMPDSSVAVVETDTSEDTWAETILGIATTRQQPLDAQRSLQDEVDAYLLDSQISNLNSALIYWNPLANRLASYNCLEPVQAKLVQIKSEIFTTSRYYTPFERSKSVNLKVKSTGLRVFILILRRAGEGSARLKGGVMRQVRILDGQVIVASVPFEFYLLSVTSLGTKMLQDEPELINR
ncbi:hypothetical protein DEU56DRAFT_754162 [Suillus clintonianus]|uniref:uncharacterized protein n=1 Tax=Suillus clintonianus TaxID=1904413 RepID=UPI001B885290|nr:uncharacterized protein DEU56DRAFT_754162 [Suillus clintonianus]KAG2144490.1 hypothetical protein DEU56DRAFT_754162 [Suillus clintonianus]